MYDFVTTPRNWEGTHPVTAYVSGTQADRPTQLGRTFHEHIVGPYGPDGPAVEAIWEVTRVHRGEAWTIESRYFDGRHIDVTIEYRIEPHTGFCTLTRTMTTELPVLPQLHRDRAFPPPEVLPTPLPRLGLNELVTHQHPIDRRQRRDRPLAAVGTGKLEAQPLRTPPGMSSPELTDLHLDRRRHLGRVPVRPMRPVSQRIWFELGRVLVGKSLVDVALNRFADRGLHQLAQQVGRRPTVGRELRTSSALAKPTNQSQRSAPEGTGQGQPARSCGLFADCATGSHGQAPPREMPDQRIRGGRYGTRTHDLCRVKAAL